MTFTDFAVAEQAVDLAAKASFEAERAQVKAAIGTDDIGGQPMTWERLPERIRQHRRDLMRAALEVFLNFQAEHGRHRETPPR